MKHHHSGNQFTLNSLQPSLYLVIRCNDVVLCNAKVSYVINLFLLLCLLKVSPMPQGDDGESMSGESELQLDHCMFVQQPSRLSNYRDSPFHVPNDEDSIGGKTDETSLGMSVSTNKELIISSYVLSTIVLTL